MFLTHQTVRVCAVNWKEDLWQEMSLSAPLASTTLVSIILGHPRLLHTMETLCIPSFTTTVKPAKPKFIKTECGKRETVHIQNGGTCTCDWCMGEITNTKGALLILCSHTTQCLQCFIHRNDQMSTLGYSVHDCIFSTNETPENVAHICSLLPWVLGVHGWLHAICTDKLSDQLWWDTLSV